ncbi:pyroglutamyl-peptidase 1 isoform X2 [Anthonomus grandis grandis]|uniref:pyroglutamyl-peptidase 1 isoform X2 n=1 Tax=Anthonomus grandis grandis TaxID=2921223 RepID=UPI002166B548|nr:pyroglutamyl-peptidase 1 isoform X2 [Anthonomus grandis grandis]
MEKVPESSNILVTGFGPFGIHNVNASWEAVKSLPDKIQGYRIIKEEIPVSYKHVEDNIPLLWLQYQPKLVVHVGVSALAEEITIETCSNKTGYLRPDVEEKCLPNSEARCGTDHCLKTGISTKAICERVNKHPKIKACTSADAGRYLCEYIYYISLNQDNKRTLFIHVPPLDKPYSKAELTEALEEVIKAALELISEEEKGYDYYLPPEASRIYKNGRAAAMT